MFFLIFFSSVSGIVTSLQKKNYILVCPPPSNKNSTNYLPFPPPKKSPIQKQKKFKSISLFSPFKKIVIKIILKKY